MVEYVPDDPEADMDEYEKQFQRLSSTADVHRDAWTQTLEDLDALAERREEEGWDVVVVRAQDTGLEAPGDEQGPEDRFGLVYVVPDNDAEAFVDAFEDGEYPTYDVYRAETEGRIFLVTELLDPDAETAILVASSFWKHAAERLAETAKAEGEMYTHVQTLDGTHLGSFRHEGYEKFFPGA